MSRCIFLYFIGSFILVISDASSQPIGIVDLPRDSHLVYEWAEEGKPILIIKSTETDDAGIINLKITGFYHEEFPVFPVGPVYFTVDVLQGEMLPYKYLVQIADENFEPVVSPDRLFFEIKVANQIKIEGVLGGQKFELTREFSL